MWSGAALPHFGRYGKGGDTCFFCPFDKFFGHFFLFFAPMSPDFAHCVTCFWNIQNPRYGNCHTCHTGVAASACGRTLFVLQSWSIIWTRFQMSKQTFCVDRRTAANSGSDLLKSESKCRRLHFLSLWYFIIYRTISACRNWKLSLSTRKEWAGFAKTLQ